MTDEADAHYRIMHPSEHKKLKERGKKLKLKKLRADDGFPEYEETDA
jgi:hypothetical protein